MNIKISKLFVFITIIILVIIVSSLFYIKEIRKNAIEIKEYQKNKYLMFEKIYEFKNNIDTLSKLAKEYVYTKDSSLKKDMMKF